MARAAVKEDYLSLENEEPAKILAAKAADQDGSGVTRLNKKFDGRY